MIAASALHAGCDTLWSEDMQHGMALDEGLRIVNPFLAESSAAQPSLIFVVSAPPAGGYGTITWMGRVGLEIGRARCG